MTDREKLELINKIMFSRFDWMESYRQTFFVPPGIGLPSGITGSEVDMCLIRRILEDKSVIIVEY